MRWSCIGPVLTESGYVCRWRDDDEWDCEACHRAEEQARADEADAWYDRMVYQEGE